MPACKLTDEQYAEIRRWAEVREGIPTRTQLATEFGVHINTILKAEKGEMRKLEQRYQAAKKRQQEEIERRQRELVRRVP